MNTPQPYIILSMAGKKKDPMKNAPYDLSHACVKIT